MKSVSRQIDKIEKKEKKGSYGHWRKNFCSQYVRQLSRAQRHASADLVSTLAGTGESISCRKGCTYCCQHYVSVSVAQGIAIADFLYRDRIALRNFLAQVEAWKEQAMPLASRIDSERNRALAAGTAVDRIIVKTRPLAERYRQEQIPCPFLAGDRCSIYPVRPNACAGHHALSPPLHCSPDSPQDPRIRNALIRDEELLQMVQLTDPRLSLYELSLPLLVYRLLTEGGAALMEEAR